MMEMVFMASSSSLVALAMVPMLRFFPPAVLGQGGHVIFFFFFFFADGAVIPEASDCRDLTLICQHCIH